MHSNLSRFERGYCHDATKQDNNCSLVIDSSILSLTPFPPRVGDLTMDIQPARAYIQKPGRTTQS